MAVENVKSAATCLHQNVQRVVYLTLFFSAFLTYRCLFSIHVTRFISPGRIIVCRDLIVNTDIVNFFIHPVLCCHHPRTVSTADSIANILLITTLLLLVVTIRIRIMVTNNLITYYTLNCYKSATRTGFTEHFTQAPYLTHTTTLSCTVNILIRILGRVIVPINVPRRTILIIYTVTRITLLRNTQHTGLHSRSSPDFRPDTTKLSMSTLRCNTG